MRMAAIPAKTEGPVMMKMIMMFMMMMIIK